MKNLTPENPAPSISSPDAFGGESPPVLRYAGTQEDALIAFLMDDPAIAAATSGRFEFGIDCLNGMMADMPCVRYRLVEARSPGCRRTAFSVSVLYDEMEALRIARLLVVRLGERVQIGFDGGVLGDPEVHEPWVERAGNIAVARVEVVHRVEYTKPG